MMETIGFILIFAMCIVAFGSLWAFNAWMSAVNREMDRMNDDLKELKNEQRNHT